jgi:hypothetical protein
MPPHAVESWLDPPGNDLQPRGGDPETFGSGTGVEEVVSKTAKTGHFIGPAFVVADDLHLNHSSISTVGFQSLTSVCGSCAFSSSFFQYLLKEM